MSRKKKRSRGNPVKSSRPIGSPAKRIDQTISACERWLSEGNNTTGGEADQVIELLAASQQPDGSLALLPPQPEFVEEMLETANSGGMDTWVPVAQTLDRYFHFLTESPEFTAEPESLAACLDLVHEDLGEIEEGPGHALERLIRPYDEQGIAERRRDLAEVRLVTGVEHFLDWLGEGRPCSPKGGLQRKDIAPVAAMIGLSVKGTHTKHDDAGHRVDLPALEPLFDDEASAPPQQHPVMSMWEVPELTAWWQAMQAVGIFSRSGTRVLRDQGAELWRSADELEALDIRQEFLAVFVERFFAAEAEPFQRGDFFTSLAPPTIAAAAAELVAALYRENGDEPPQLIDQDRAGLFGLRARVLLRRLADLGLLRGEEGAYVVPAGLRQAIVQGVLMTRDAQLEEADEDDAEE